MIDLKNKYIPLKELFEYVEQAVATVDRQDRLKEIIQAFPAVLDYFKLVDGGYKDIDAIVLKKNTKSVHKGRYNHDVTFTKFLQKELPKLRKDGKMNLLNKTGYYNRVLMDMNNDDIDYIVKALRGEYAFNQVAINNTVLEAIGITKK